MVELSALCRWRLAPDIGHTLAPARISAAFCALPVSVSTALAPKLCSTLLLLSSRFNSLSVLRTFTSLNSTLCAIWLLGMRVSGPYRQRHSQMLPNSHMLLSQRSRVLSQIMDCNTVAIATNFSCDVPMATQRLLGFPCKACMDPRVFTKNPKAKEVQRQPPEFSVHRVYKLFVQLCAFAKNQMKRTEPALPHIQSCTRSSRGRS